MTTVLELEILYLVATKKTSPIRKTATSIIPEPKLRVAKNPFIRLEDFVSKEISVFAYNVTSNTEIKRYKEIQLVEIADTYIILRVPKSACAQGHSLWIHILPSENAKNFEKIPKNKEIPGAISISGKAVAIEDSEGSFKSIRFEFAQFAEREWQGFLREVHEKQVKVDVVFKSIKD